jgi:hypothetical protein
MGWFAPPDQFIGSTRHDSAFVISGAPGIERFPWRAYLDSTQRVEVSREHRVACDAPDSLSAYVSRPVAEPIRALYAGRAFAGRVQSGARYAQLSDSALARARRLLVEGAPPARLFRDTAIQVAPELPVYSFHLAYDSTRTLRRAGMFLHERDGRLLGREIVATDTARCADCGDPTYDDGIRAWFRIVNAFELPGFRYPVLLLDTSTLEGRALSLVTFSPVGVASHFRQYEYALDCVAGR